MKKRKIAILGATGLVGRRLAELLIDHPWFEIGMLVGSHQSAGETYEQIWQRKETQLQLHYGIDNWQKRSFPEKLKNIVIRSFNDLLHSDIEYIFSSVPERAGELEQKLLEKGRTVFSNSPYGRFENGNRLVVAEVNSKEMEDQSFIKSPNCVTAGLVLTLAPLRERYGLEQISLTTYQSISGRGDAKYPPELVKGNVYPLHCSQEHTEEYIVREVRKVLNQVIPTSVSCNRVWVQEGHFVDVRVVTTTKITSDQEVRAVFQAYNPLKTFNLPTKPDHPLVVINEIGRPRPCQDAWHQNGMAVALGGISTSDEIFDLRFQYVVNNLIRGAAGGVLLNAELYFVIQQDK